MSDKKPAALEVIKQENARLVEAKRDAELLSLGYIKHLHEVHKVELDVIRTALSQQDRYMGFIQSIFPNVRPLCLAGKKAFNGINEARLFLDTPPYSKADLDTVLESAEKALKKAPKARAPSAESVEKKVRVARKARPRND